MKLKKLHFIFLCLLPVVLFADEDRKNSDSSESGAFYSPFGKRDPFHVPILGQSAQESAVSPLQRYHFDQYKLRGIMRGLGSPKAMFQDPTGKTHIVQQTDQIGIEKAVVSRILKSEVIITQKTFNFMGKEILMERVVTLPKDPESEPEQLANAAKTSRAPISLANPNSEPDIAFAVPGRGLTNSDNQADSTSSQSPQSFDGIEQPEKKENAQSAGSNLDYSNRIQLNPVVSPPVEMINKVP